MDTMKKDRDLDKLEAIGIKIMDLSIDQDSPGYTASNPGSLIPDHEDISEKNNPQIEPSKEPATENLNINGSTHDETQDSYSQDHETDDNSGDDTDEMSTLNGRENNRNQHVELIKKLRLQLRDLEKYAYERGELDQVPASVLAERQSVILETLRERLSLNISADEIETLKLDELKKQIDKEIHDLIDPLLSQESLLKQLRTQLIDLERYIDHLHGTLGEIHRREGCTCMNPKSCSIRGTHDYDVTSDQLAQPTTDPHNSISKTSRLIRDLITQIICSDVKVQNRANQDQQNSETGKVHQSSNGNVGEATSNTSKSSDSAAWILHIDKVVLATDSLINLYTVEPQPNRLKDKQVDESLVESVARRQLVPAIRDLLSYGLIDTNLMPRSSSYVSMIFNPYYILSTLTCFPSSQKTQRSTTSCPTSDKIHVWSVIEEYYRTRNEPAFQSSSIKTLSQSFNLSASISGPIQITSKQALLIALDEIIETLSKCKPNGPESHFKAFIYTALNRRKLSTWLRLVFKNKSITKKYYHSFGFVYQQDKMDKLLTTLEALAQFEFTLQTNVEPTDQYIGAF